MEPFPILAFAGCAWNLFGLIYLAPRLIPHDWFERGIADFGQSTGMTVTGLLLMRISDPPNRSQALESFGYKQLLFEPVVGGDLFTVAAVPLATGTSRPLGDAGNNGKRNDCIASVWIPRVWKRRQGCPGGWEISLG